MQHSVEPASVLLLWESPLFQQPAGFLLKVPMHTTPNEQIGRCLIVATAYNVHLLVVVADVYTHYHYDLRRNILQASQCDRQHEDNKRL